MKQSLSTGLHTYEIPSDWRVGLVGDFMKIETGSRNTQDRVSDGRYPFYVRSQTVEHINSYSFDGEAVLTAGDGVGTGKVFHYIYGKFDCHQRVYRMSQFSDGLYGRYFYWFFSSFFYDRVMSMTAKSSVDSVRRDMISKMDLALPPIAEQRRIAQSLDDIDSLIHILDKLIAKKRAMKQGAMQQLLTGKTWLPGFSGEWEEVLLGSPNVSTIKSGGTPSTAIDSFWNGDIPWVTPTDITSTIGKYLSSSVRKITLDGLANCSAQMLPSGALLLCSRATVGEIRIATLPVCTNQGFKAVIAASGVSNEFLYYKLLTMRDQMLERSFGSTFLELPMREAAALPFSLPSYAEQQAIAEVLCNMDAEIDALAARREKTALIKTGMMQELLTGRTRLI